MRLDTVLFNDEGRENVKDTIQAVVHFVNHFAVASVIVFAASAENVVVLRNTLPERTRLVAVTFPAGFTAEVGGQATFVGMPSQADRRRLIDARVELVQGVMPFRGLGVAESEQIQTIRRLLDLFGGGMQLCVQSVLMACDAGSIVPNERCIAMSADTAILVRGENAFRFLEPESRFAIEHVICKPVRYSITKPQQAIETIEVDANPNSGSVTTGEQLDALPSGSVGDDPIG
jgi:hypothetical protein